MNKSLSLIFLFGIFLAVTSISHQQIENPWAGLPSGWAVSQAQTNFKNITNLNAHNWIVGNQTIDDYNKELYTFITNNNVTKCPLETPFLRGSDSQCVKCTEPTPVFDLYQKNCVACPAGTLLNTQTHQCQKGQTPKPTTKCISNYVWSDSQNKCVCPVASPIDLGCQCVKCLQPFVWSSTQKACTLRCDDTHIWNNNKQKCECPNSAPYQFNGQCISCNAPFQWQSTTNTCQLQVNDCVAPQVQTCTSNFVWDSIVKKCVCPQNLPFNDGTKCLQCDLPQYWDHDVKQCLNCPNNLYFNPLSRSCEPCPAARPLWKNYVCQACPAGTSYNQLSNSCQAQDTFIDPSTTAKVPVVTTVPADEGFIDPAATAKVPVYTTTPTQ